MKRYRRAAAVGVSILTALGIGGAVASPASAATSNCASGYFCIWEDHDYQTNGSGSALVRFEFYIPNYGLWNYSGTSLNAANSASSLYNHSSGGNRVRIFTETNQNGAGYWIGPGSVRNNLATSIAPSGFNDDIESAYFETQLSAL